VTRRRVERERSVDMTEHDREGHHRDSKRYAAEDATENSESVTVSHYRPALRRFVIARD
jgi:hypothetical protein